MKIKSVRASVHRFAVTVPLLKEPIHRNAVFCEVETDNGLVGHGLTGGAYLPLAIVTALEKEFFPVVKDMDMIDANYKFNPVDARQLCREIEDCNLTWFEEPLYQNDTRAMADLRQHTHIPISAGQNEGHRWRLRELVLHQAVDILQPNCCYCGGYTEAAKAGHLAQAFNLPIANGGGWPLHNMHTMAGLMNGWRVEFHLDMQAVGEMIFVNPPKPENNIVKLPAKPGLGLEPNRDVLKDTLVKA